MYHRRTARLRLMKGPATRRRHGMRNDPAVVLLVTTARDGDKAAWDALVERYAPLVWSICRRHRLTAADSEDVGQSVWLRLVEHLATLREPAALPGWIATTTQRECLRVLKLGRRTEPIDPQASEHDMVDDAVPVDQELLLQERRLALRTAFTQLSLRCQQLLSMVIGDPPRPYSEISRSLHIPIGSIGPSRARCLDRLRHCSALVALIEVEPERA
jgi:RNA polymerase sigma factor (sigma-70 family)